MSMFYRCHHHKEVIDPTQAMAYAQQAREKAEGKAQELTPLISRLESAVKRNKIFESIVTTLRTSDYPHDGSEYKGG